ncbi:MAG: PD-(D/E)XK nuclease family protein [Planctomycetaceae bacterium]
MSQTASRTVYLGRTRPLLHAAVDYLWQTWPATDSDAMLFEPERIWDLSNLLLVLPTARSLRRLGTLLEEKSSQQSAVLNRPKLITVGELPERLFSPALPIASELEQTLAWAGALAATSDAQLSSLLSNLPPREPLAPWLELASTISSLHSDLAAGELDFHDVEKEVEGEAEQRRWQLLRSLHAKYLHELKSAGRSDPFFARAQALAKKKCRSSQDIVLIGTSDLTRSVTSLLRAVVEANSSAKKASGTVTALVAATEADRDHFDSFGSIIASQWVRYELPLQDDQLLAAQDVADQASVAADLIESWTAAYTADPVTIGVTDESLVGATEFELRSRGLNSHRELGWTVAQTPVGRLLERLADHLARGTWRSLAALVRHADVYEFIDWALCEHSRAAPAEGRTDCNWLTSFDNLLANHYPTRCDNELPAEGLRSCAEAITVRDLIQHSLRELRGPARTLSDWAGRVAAWLAQVYHFEDGTQKNDPASRNGQAIATAFTFMHAVQELEKALDVKVSAASAIELLIARLGQLRVTDTPLSAPSSPARHLPLDNHWPAAATAPGSVSKPPAESGSAANQLTISGWLDLALDDSPRMVIIGLNHPYVPESVTADPFLPGSLRTRLQLNDNERRLARDIHALDVILSSRREVKLIVGARGLDGSPTPPSRLLAAAAPIDAARRLVSLLDPPSPATRSLTSSPAASSPAACSPAAKVRRWKGTAGRSNLPTPVLPRDRTVQWMSVTGFKDYLVCPYRFYLRHVLHLKPLVDSSGELQANQFGDLIHNTLDWFGKSDLKDSTSQSAIEDALHQTLDQYATHYFGTAPLAAVRLQIEQARRRLSAVAIAQSERRRAGWHIHSVETAFGEQQSAGIDVDGVCMPIRGRIDRIDRHDDGRWAIIDYKTHGHHPRKKHLRYENDSPQWTDLQLPLYQLLIPFVIEEPVETKNVALSYFNIGDNLGQTKINDADFKLEEYASAVETIQDCIRRIRSGHFEPATDVVFDDYSMILQTGSAATWLDQWIDSDAGSDLLLAGGDV